MEWPLPGLLNTDEKLHRKGTKFGPLYLNSGIWEHFIAVRRGCFGRAAAARDGRA